MRTKQKLRRSFDRSAPDVLGRVLQDLPQQNTSSTTVSIPAPRKQAFIRELAATAAAFVLLIAAAGGAAWYFRSGSTITPATNPTGESAPTHPNVTDPIEPCPEVYVEDLDYQAEDILYPWYQRDSVYYEPEVKTLLSDICSEDIYVLEKTMGEYAYAFHFDAWDGSLMGITIAGGDTAAGFISKTVAGAIARLNAKNHRDDTVFTDGSQLVQTGSSGYYCVTVSGNPSLFTATYYIHAKTGQLLTLGEEIEPGYTVGPPPEVATTPPDGMLTEDIAILKALEYAGLKEAADIQCTMPEITAYYITFNDGKYHYEITLDAYSAELLAFPTPVLLEDSRTPPVGDSMIGDALALQTALDYLGVTEDQVVCHEIGFVAGRENHYLLTIDYGETRFHIAVGAYSPYVVYCEKYPLATAVTARDYALEHIGVLLADVNYLRIEQDPGGESDNPGFLIWIEAEGKQYQFTQDCYGKIIDFSTQEVPRSEDLGRTGLIGWRAARDIFLDASNLTLEEMTQFSYRFVEKDGYDAYYELTFNQSYIGMIVAKNGEFFYEGDSDGKTEYTNAILTAEEITQIALAALPSDVKMLYDRYKDYPESYRIVSNVVYTCSGKPFLVYEWQLCIDLYACNYQLDAFTGEILSSVIYE